MVRSAHLVLLAQDAVHSLQLWRTVLLSQGLTVVVVPNSTPLRAYLTGADQKYPVHMLVLDLKVLSREGLSLATFGAWFARNCPALELVVTTDAKFDIDTAEQAWARAHGAADLLPSLAPELADLTAAHVVERLIAPLAIAKVKDDELRKALGTGAAASPTGNDAKARAYAHSRRLEAEGIDLTQLAFDLSAAVPCAQRFYLGKAYTNCFLGSEACTWLAKRFQRDRAAATAIGQALLVRGYVHHVIKEQGFIDGEYFYRYVGDLAPVEAIDLDQVVSDMQAASGLIATRSYRGTSYPSCFVGSEAVDWLCKHYSISREQAVSLGQRLHDLRLLQHVVDERDFVDDYFFYGFATRAE